MYEANRPSPEPFARSLQAVAPTTPQEADLLGWAVSPFVHLLSTARLQSWNLRCLLKNISSLLLWPHSFWAFLRLPQNGSFHPSSSAVPIHTWIHLLMGLHRIWSSQHRLSQISTQVLSHRESGLTVSPCPFENHRVKICSCLLTARASACTSHTYTYTYVCIRIHLRSLRLSVQSGAEFLETCVHEFAGPGASPLPQALALTGFLPNNILLELISL